MEGCDYTVAVAGGGAVRCKPEPATNRRGAVQSATLKVKLCKYVIRRSFSQVAHQQGLTNRPIVGTGREVIKKNFFSTSSAPARVRYLFIENGICINK